MQEFFKRNEENIDIGIKVVCPLETNVWNDFSKPLKPVDLLFSPGSMYGELDPDIENMKFDF